jgi:tight adherence protein C
VITMMLIGAGLGGVVFAVIYRYAPRKTSPLVALGQFDARARATASPVEAPTLRQSGRDVAGRVGQLVACELARRGIANTKLRQDLALTAQSFDAVMGRKVIAGVCGFVGGVVSVILLQSLGVHIPPGSPPLVAVLAAVAFFLAPDNDIRRGARRRRQDFRRAFATYLELVSLQMAGMAAPEQALVTAARESDEWPMALVQQTLDRARLSGPGFGSWNALAALGERIGVDELRDLGGLVKLVADDGAQIRKTLMARAASMRRHELADAEGAAEQKDQSMRLAQILIAVGFMIFVGYPAFTNVLHI